MARILIVEDSAVMRSYTRSALEDPEAGLTGQVDVVEATSGLDALRLLPRGEFDLVITDINMPDINGLELIKFIRQSDRYNDVALLIISSQHAAVDVERARKLGADGFVAKPFTSEALKAAVVETLAKHKPTDTNTDAKGS